TDESTVPYFESLSRDIEKVEGVEEVRAITRPTGSVIDEFTVDFQLGLLSEGVTDAGAGLSDVQEGLGEIEETLAGISQQTGAEGVSEAAAGLGGLNEQLNLTAQGLQQTGDVQQTVGAIGQISGGLTEIQQGLQAASGQLGELGPGLAQLAEGIGASNDGLAEIESGLVEAADMMQQMSDSETVRDTGLFIPEGTLEEADLASLLETYTFAGDTGMVMEVILSEDPYSPEAIDIVGNLKETVSRAIVNTPIEGSVVAFGGISSINSDLAEVSSNDFTRTVTIMLVSLLVVLMVLLRSLIMPIYMIASLLLTYYTSLAITELIFVNGLGYDGITWAVPFFGFVMLVALGVDYSIFLLDRFQEEAVNGVHVMEAMRTSMAKMGTVIITAAIILAGTFGAMMPSGVLSLMQIATIVITGLLLYGLIVLPLLIPAVTVSFGRGAWWPFNTKNR
ncbi:MAG TPA: MMPL family transporter, partial [Planococcus sp. (in: firmicutes)]|nr:MMPL family transporter [Planococcus sp. (in: firmicutes)]